MYALGFLANRLCFLSSSAQSPSSVRWRRAFQSCHHTLILSCNNCAKKSVKKKHCQKGEIILLKGWRANVLPYGADCNVQSRFRVNHTSSISVRWGLMLNVPSPPAYSGTRYCTWWASHTNVGLKQGCFISYYLFCENQVQESNSFVNQDSIFFFDVVIVTNISATVYYTHFEWGERTADTSLLSV